VALNHVKGQVQRLHELLDFDTLRLISKGDKDPIPVFIDWQAGGLLVG